MLLCSEERKKNRSLSTAGIKSESIFTKHCILSYEYMTINFTCINHVWYSVAYLFFMQSIECIIQRMDLQSVVGKIVKQKEHPKNAILNCFPPVTNVDAYTEIY